MYIYVNVYKNVNKIIYDHFYRFHGIPIYTLTNKIEYKSRARRNNVITTFFIYMHSLYNIIAPSPRNGDSVTLIKKDC